MKRQQAVRLALHYVMEAGEKIKSAKSCAYPVTRLRYLTDAFARLRHAEYLLNAADRKRIEGGG